jgi:hypothetical protein
VSDPAFTFVMSHPIMTAGAKRSFEFLVAILAGPAVADMLAPTTTVAPTNYVKSHDSI